MNNQIQYQKVNIKPIGKIFLSGLFVICSMLFTAVLFGQDNGDASYQQAFRNWDQKQWDLAITQFTEFINRYPKSTYRNDAELRLADSYLRRGNFVDPTENANAGEHLKYIINQGDKASNYKEASLHYVFSLYGVNNYKEAKPLLDAYIKKYPNDNSLQDAYYYMAVCEFHLENYQQAEYYYSLCMNTFPNNKWRAQCQLGHAITVGRLGRYAEADRELTNLTLDSSYPLIPETIIQRAHLKIEQKLYAEALQILESFILRYRNEQGHQQYIVEAYQYEAHCYMMQNNYESMLRVAEEIDKINNQSIEAALLKIKALVKLKRFSEAQTIMDQLRNSRFGLNSSDVLTYYNSLILLGEGKWNECINSLNTLLQVQNSSDNQNSIVLNYYNNSSQNNKLLSKDFLYAGGNLVNAYASRYSATHQYPNDNFMQQAIFDALYRYARQQSSNELLNIMAEIDMERNGILNTASSVGTGTPVVLKPNTSGTGTTESAYPSMVTPGSMAPGTSGASGSNNIGMSGGPGGGRPDMPNNLQPSNNASNPGGGIPNNPVIPNQAGNIPAVNNQPNAGQQITTNGLPVTSPTAGGGTDANVSTGKKITELEASSQLNRAGEALRNQDLERAHSILTNLMTTSETFWQDCPMQAPAVALMLSQALFLMGKYQNAINICNMIVKQAPNTPQATEAYYYLGYCYDHNGEREKAIESFEKTVNSSYDCNYTPSAYYYLGMNEWERKNTLVAENYFRKLYRSYSNSDFRGHAAWAIAQIEFNAQNYKEAEQIVNTELENKPDVAIVDWLLFLKGEIALKLNDSEKARLAFTFIVNQYPESQKLTLARNRLDNLPKLKTTTAKQEK